MTGINRPGGISPHNSPLWLTEDDIRDLVSLNEAMDALDSVLAAEASNQASNVDKALGLWNGRSSMHALGSMMPERGYVGFKTWVNTPNGAATVYALSDAHDGRLLALMQAGSLGQLRTAGISGVATAALADPHADEMTLIGTGAQALMQVAAVAARKPLRRLRVYSPTAEKRRAFVERARASFAFTVDEATSAQMAVEGAPIVTLITRATTPFLTGDMLAPGAHVNAAGGILPGNAEFTQDVFDRTGLMVVDSIANAMKASAEFKLRFGTDREGWSNVRTLAEVLASPVERASDGRITLFKPMGMGLSDLAVASQAYEAAVAKGIGSRLPTGTRGALRWQAAVPVR